MDVLRIFMSERRQICLVFKRDLVEAASEGIEGHYIAQDGPMWIAADVTGPDARVYGGLTFQRACRRAIGYPEPIRRNRH